RLGSRAGDSWRGSVREGSPPFGAMKFRFHPDAEAESLAAIEWYEDHAAGLGADFAVEIQAGIERAVAIPEASPSLGGDVRRVLIRRFPYGVVDAVRGECLLVLAVMHLRRSPDYWRERR
ncbi:MAG: hypothetical protein WBP72_15095, partial [Rhodocyclaceae bacterium]